MLFRKDEIGADVLAMTHVHLIENRHVVDIIIEGHELDAVERIDAGKNSDIVLPEIDQARANLLKFVGDPAAFFVDPIRSRW